MCVDVSAWVMCGLIAAFGSASKGSGFGLPDTIDPVKRDCRHATSAGFASEIAKDADRHMCRARIDAIAGAGTGALFDNK